MEILGLVRNVVGVSVVTVGMIIMNRHGRGLYINTAYKEMEKRKEQLRMEDGIREMLHREQRDV
jgi:hypothetical protein